MSEIQIQAIKDVIRMVPRLNLECLNSIKILTSANNKDQIYK